MKNIVFFDLDGTLITGQSQKYLISYLYKINLISFYRLILLYLWFIGYKFNILKNPKIPLNIAFKIIEGKTVKEVAVVMQDFYNNILKQKLNNQVIKKLKIHQNNGDEIILLSMAVAPVAQVVGEKIGISNIISTKLEIQSGSYTGKIEGELVYGNEKAKIINVKYKNELLNSYAYADHYSDYGLLKIVRHPVLVNPSKKTQNYFKKYKIPNLRIL
jgi:HAD superfamily hydrolase (TIGR01490 family)